MPYISTERVAEIRAQIKKEFPEYKFSITKDHSTVRVKILSGPIEFLVDENEMQRGYGQVNHYYIHEHYKNFPEALEVLKRIDDIMNVGNGVLVEDGDYGTVPNFYTDISIGDYEKRYEVTKGKGKPAPVEFEKIEVQPGEVNIIDYSEKAIAVIGDTKPIKEKLKELKGIFNPRLSCGPGWIFPKTKLAMIQNALTQPSHV